MNFDLIITGNTFGSFLTLFLLTKNFDISVAQIIPEISIIRDMKLFIPASTFKNIPIPFKTIMENDFQTYNRISLYLFNQEKTLQSEKKIIISTTLDKIRKFLQNNIKNPRKYKTFQGTIKEVHFNNDKIFIKLSNNKIISSQYLIVCDDFWGSIWNLINFKPQHTGGWIIKTPLTTTIKSKPFIAFGYSKKGTILSDSENIIFAKHINKEYTIEDLISNFLLTNKIVEKLVIKDWNKYVLPFTTKNYSFHNEIKNKKIFFVTEYLGLVNCFLPEYTTLTSMLARELSDHLDTKIKTLEDFTPLLNKIIEYNQIFLKLSNFINSFPLIFFKNEEKDKLIIDILIGNINPQIMDDRLRKIFENYDRNFEVTLSERALTES
ncbi:MAG: hypothetical protein RMJ36_02385 [Candidatus Calescibacterium sp.]|nr:hypothetical protein [Candidatus Calescibacterium sp.]MDW8132486.1 hypothetical protein [Candidatus Calescibacterium sp.]